MYSGIDCHSETEGILYEGNTCETTTPAGSADPSMIIQGANAIVKGNHIPNAVGAGIIFQPKVNPLCLRNGTNYLTAQNNYIDSSAGSGIFFDMGATGMTGIRENNPAHRVLLSPNSLSTTGCTKAP